MPNINPEDLSDRRSEYLDSVNPEDLIADDDLLMEQILKNINTTPIGQVLKKIASLPDVRRKKVLDVRCQLHRGTYDIDQRLKAAIDKVLEDLTT